MDKRDITIRIVDTKTGEILNEINYTNKFNFHFRADRKVLHDVLDDFIDKIRKSSFNDTLSLEFVVINPYVQGVLPF